MKDKRWHLNKNGEPAVCTALPGNCPLGGEHYSSLHDATIAAEAVTKTRFKNTNDKTPSGVLSKKARVVTSSPVIVTAKDVKEAASAGKAIMARARESFGVPLPPRPVPLPPKPSTEPPAPPVPLPPKPIKTSTEPPAPPIPLPPRSIRTSAEPPAPPKPLDLMDSEKPVPVGFLPEFDLKQKNVALDRLGQLRPDLSYTSMMGDKQCTAARYNTYVERLEETLKTDEDARNALSAVVEEVRLAVPDPPKPPRQATSRSKMWELLG